MIVSHLLRFGGAMLRTLAVCAVLAVLAGPAGAQPQPADDAGFGFEEVDDAPPALADVVLGQTLDLALFGAFAALALTSFLRKSVRLKYVTLVASVLYLGFYKSQLLSIVNIFSTLKGNPPLFLSNLGWSAFVVFAVVTTVLWGRVYCGRVCAFGALTQLIDAVMPARLRVTVPAALERRLSFVKYVVLFAAVGYFLATDDNLFYRYIEPFWLFSREGTTALWIGVGVLLLASVFVRNLYCRFLCPLGAALGLVSLLTVFKIKRWSECSQCRLCEKTCEWGAIRQRKIVLTECVRCDDCEILYDDKQRCPHWLLEAKRKVRAALS
jgi:NosR/NirI family nitrous oxide reductase transcriptional regulator